MKITVHDKKVCQPPCPFHAPSDHPLKDASIHVRTDKDFLVERICDHGVGHDDPDSVAYMQKQGHEWAGVHGCDGCCTGNYGKIETSPAPYKGGSTPGMNQALGLPFQDDGKMQKVAICFDVDGTLITTDKGAERDLYTRLLINMSIAFKNSKIVIWSGGGNAYAEQRARELDIHELAWKFMSKHQHVELKALGYKIIAIDDIQDTAIGDINLIVRQ